MSEYCQEHLPHAPLMRKDECPCCRLQSQLADMTYARDQVQVLLDTAHHHNEELQAQVDAVRDIVRWSTKYDHGDTAVDTVMAVQKALQEQKP